MLKNQIFRELSGIFLIFWGLLVLLSLITYDQSDPAINHAVSSAQSVKNSVGLFGAYLSGILVDIFGVASLLWPALFIAWGISCISTWLLLPWWRWCGFTLLATCLISLGAAWNFGLGDVRGGGMLGMSLYQKGNSFFNPLGSILVWLFLLFLSLELAFGIAWFNLIMGAWMRLYTCIRKKMPSLPKLKCLLPAMLRTIWQNAMQDTEQESLQKQNSKNDKENDEVISLYDIHVEDADSLGAGKKSVQSAEQNSAAQAESDIPESASQQEMIKSTPFGEPYAVRRARKAAERTSNASGKIFQKAQPTPDQHAVPQTDSQLSSHADPELHASRQAKLSAPDADQSIDAMQKSHAAEAEPISTVPPISAEAVQNKVPVSESSILPEIPSPVVLEQPAIQNQPTQYILPATDLLLPPKKSDAPPDATLLAEQSQQLMACLADFNIQGELIRVTPGPVITLFEIRPASGVRVGRIASLNDDIARGLRAEAVRIQAPVPGSDTVGIEIPNQVRATVNFREIIESDAFQNSTSKLSMALGKDTEGRPCVEDLAGMPHILVAGTTGSGKSVCLNSILLSFLYKATPNEVRIILVDPKRVEMAMYRDMPHLIHPVVTETAVAKTALEWAVHEMERRYDCLAKLGVRNIQDYNRKLMHMQQPAAIPDPVPLPWLVIIIDELADLMMAVGKEVEACLVRLAQLARAAGIHLIVATQRPSVDIVTGILRANFPCRIAFQVSNKYDSRTILDASGAEKLLGKGDMLFKSSSGKIQRLHGPFVSDEEVEAVVNHWKAQCPVHYAIDFSEMANRENKGMHGSSTNLTPSPEEEALYAEVVTFVQEQGGHTSISLLQRRFRIGFNKAARFVERMEAEGILPPSARRAGAIRQGQ